MYVKKKMYLSDNLMTNNKNDLYTHENSGLPLRFPVFLLKSLIFWEFLCLFFTMAKIQQLLSSCTCLHCQTCKHKHYIGRLCLPKQI